MKEKKKQSSSILFTCTVANRKFKSFRNQNWGKNYMSPFHELTEIGQNYHKKSLKIQVSHPVKYTFWLEQKIARWSEWLSWIITDNTNKNLLPGQKCLSNECWKQSQVSWIASSQKPKRFHFVDVDCIYIQYINVGMYTTLFYSLNH